MEKQQLLFHTIWKIITKNYLEFHIPKNGTFWIIFSGDFQETQNLKLWGVMAWLLKIITKITERKGSSPFFWNWDAGCTKMLSKNVQPWLGTGYYEM